MWQELLQNPYSLVFLRIVSIIPFVLVITLLMGKRQVGELPVFDFVIAVILGAVVGADIADPKIKHLPTALAIVLLAALQIGYSWATLRWHSFRRLTRFEPTIVIQNGQIHKGNLRRIRYSLDILIEMLRLKGVFNLADVEFAIIEPNGNLSVLKRAQADAVRPADLGLATPYRGLPTPVVYEGQVDAKALSNLGLSAEWLLGELGQRQLKAEEVFYAELDTEGRLYVTPQSVQAAPQRVSV